MTDKVIIINKKFNSKVTYNPTKRFWAWYPDIVRQEVANKILDRNRKGETVMSICRDLSDKYARSPHTLASWFREMT